MKMTARYSIAYRFFSYYYFFMEKVIAICDAIKRNSICTVR